MATVTISRSDLWPPSTTVGIYPAGSQTDGAPGAAVIASAAVDAAGNLSVTNAGIVSLTAYVAAALVGGTWRYARVRSTLDTFDAGRAVGTGTTNSTTALTGVSASLGAFAVGQRITGAGIPPGTFLIAGSGASWTMSAAATASATVPIEAYEARVSVAVLGATVVPQRAATRWRAQLRQRRATAGTS